MSEKDAAINSNFNPSDYGKKYRWKPRGGESLKDVFPRVKDFVNNLLNWEKNVSTMMVITSGGIIRLILYALRIKTLKEAMFFKAKNLEPIEVYLGSRRMRWKEAAP